MFKGSWKTTVLGIATVLNVGATAAIALLDSDPNTNVNYTLVIAQLTAGFGLIFARDNNVSSEAAGAK